MSCFSICGNQTVKKHCAKNAATNKPSKLSYCEKYPGVYTPSATALGEPAEKIAIGNAGYDKGANYLPPAFL